MNGLTYPTREDALQATFQQVVTEDCLRKQKIKKEARLLENMTLEAYEAKRQSAMTEAAKLIGEMASGGSIGLMPVSYPPVLPTFTQTLLPPTAYLSGTVPPAPPSLEDLERLCASEVPEVAKAACNALVARLEALLPKKPVEPTIFTPEAQTTIDLLRADVLRLFEEVDAAQKEVTLYREANKDLIDKAERLRRFVRPDTARLDWLESNAINYHKADYWEYDDTGGSLVVSRTSGGGRCPREALDAAMDDNK